MVAHLSITNLPTKRSMTIAGNALLPIAWLQLFNDVHQCHIAHHLNLNFLVMHHSFSTADYHRRGDIFLSHCQACWKIALQVTPGQRSTNLWELTISCVEAVISVQQSKRKKHPIQSISYTTWIIPTQPHWVECWETKQLWQTQKRKRSALQGWERGTARYCETTCSLQGESKYG